MCRPMLSHLRCDSCFITFELMTDSLLTLFSYGLL